MPETSQIVRLRIEAGAPRIACARLGEAEVIAHAGIGAISVAKLSVACRLQSADWPIHFCSERGTGFEPAMSSLKARLARDPPISSL